MEWDPDDYSIVISSLSLMLLETKMKFSLTDEVMPPDFAAEDIPQILKKLTGLMEEKSPAANMIYVFKLKHYMVKELTKLRQESALSVVIPEGMQHVDLHVTLRKLGELIYRHITMRKSRFSDKTINRLEVESFQKKEVKEKVYTYRDRTNIFLKDASEIPKNNLKTMGSNHQREETPTDHLTSRSIGKMSPDVDITRRHPVSIGYSQSKGKEFNPKHQTDISKSDLDFTGNSSQKCSPVLEEMEIEDPKETAPSELEMTLRHGNSTSKFDFQSTSSIPHTFLESPVPEVAVEGPDDCGSCQTEDHVSDLTASTSQTRVSISANDGKTSTSEKNSEKKVAVMYHVASCAGATNQFPKRSRETSLKRTKFVIPEEQTCCKKQCLHSIDEGLRVECQNMTRKQKENYVKKYVLVFPNKTAKTTNRERNRGFHRIYNLHDESVVCKTAFCKVLGGLCSDFIDKNIDRTQTENTSTSQAAHHTYDQFATREAQIQCSNYQSATSNTDSKTIRTVKVNNIQASFEKSQNISGSVNLTPENIHVDQVDRIYNCSNGMKAKSISEIMSLDSCENIADNERNNPDVLPQGEAKTYSDINSNKRIILYDKRRSSSSSQTSNHSEGVEQSFQSGTVSAKTSTQLTCVSKTNQNNIETKYLQKNNKSCHPCSALINPSSTTDQYLSGKTEELSRKCSGSLNDEMETSLPKNPTDTIRSKRIEIHVENNQPNDDDDASTKSERNTLTSLHGHLSDDETQSATDCQLRSFPLLSKKEQQCCKKQCLQVVSQDVKNDCYKLTKNEKVNYVKKYVDNISKNIGKTSRKRHKYTLHNDSVVCKTAFYKTLGVSHNFILKNITRTNTGDAVEELKQSDFSETENEAENTASVEVKTQSPATKTQTISEPVVDQYDQSDSHIMSNDETRKTSEQMSLVSNSDNKTENKNDKKSQLVWQTIQSKTKESPIPTENKTSENVSQTEQIITDASVKQSDSDVYDIQKPHVLDGDNHSYSMAKTLLSDNISTQAPPKSSCSFQCETSTQAKYSAVYESSINSPKSSMSPDFSKSLGLRLVNNVSDAPESDFSTFGSSLKGSESIDANSTITAENSNVVFVDKSQSKTPSMLNSSHMLPANASQSVLYMKQLLLGQ